MSTLVLAYAGAALPLLLFFYEGNQPVGHVLTSEVVAVEIIRTLVGSIGLVLSVPLTTWLAAIVATNDPRIRLADAHHDHHHSPPGRPPQRRRTPDTASPEADGDRNRTSDAPTPRWEDFAPDRTPKF